MLRCTVTVADHVPEMDRLKYPSNRAASVKVFWAAMLAVAMVVIGQAPCESMGLKTERNIARNTAPPLATTAAKFHPRLFPPSTLPSAVNAFHVAPPVALMSLMETFDTETVPLASLRVARDPAEVVSSVMRLPGVPDKVNALTVCVLPNVNLTVAGCTVLVMLAKVLFPTTVRTPAPPWFSVPYVRPPPWKVLSDALVMLIVEPDALTVAFVEVAIVHAAAPDPKTTADAPVIVRVRTPEFEDENVPTVNVLPFRSIAPADKVNVRVDPSVKASWSCHAPPTPLNVTGKSSVLPLVVIVLPPDVAMKVVADAPADTVMPEENTMLPATLLLPMDRAPLNPVKFRLLTFPEIASA